jgi:hypothetical protein
MNGDSPLDARRNLIITVLLVLLVAVLWQQVFAMTGVLWWNAPGGVAAQAARTPAPPPLELRAPKTGWVDLGAFLKTHPRWEP